MQITWRAENLEYASQKSMDWADHNYTGFIIKYFFQLLKKLHRYLTQAFLFELTQLL